MEFSDLNPEDKLGKNYCEHKIFEQLEYISDFYDSLSFSIMNWRTQGVLGILNLDTYAYSSIKGTIESISDILKKGRINDAYALLRKYYDSTIINIYSDLFLADNYSVNNFMVSKIDNWVKGTETIPEYRIISKYIKESPKLESINKLLSKDDTYKKIRERCNDHTHYNFYQNLLLNDNEIHNPYRTKYLDEFSKDIESIFIQHFAYIFYLNEHYLSSSDYIDYIEAGMTPIKKSQFWVASFIQKTFDEIIKAKRPDIAEEIKKNTIMDLN